MKTGTPTFPLSNDVRPTSVDTVRDALDTLRRFVQGHVIVDEFVQFFESFYYQSALDGHEDPAGSIPQLQQERTLSLRLLLVAQSVVDRVYDGAMSSEYLAAGRIARSDVKTVLVNALASAAISLASDTLHVGTEAS